MSCTVGYLLRLRELMNGHRFAEATRNPEVAQAQVLADLLDRNASTSFGSEHGFAAMRGADDYAASVPIRDYEGFRPYVRRIIFGESGVLTADQPYMFTSTSGTTGEPKLVPVTAQWREAMASMTRLWLANAVSDHPMCMAHKSLSIVSPAVEGHTDTGIPFGAMSGITYQRLPNLIRRGLAVPYEVALIADYEARYYVAMRLALAERISIVGTPNPSTLIQLARVGAENAESIVRAIHDGTLGIAAPIMKATAEVSSRMALDALRSCLRRDPARARELEQAIGSRGRLLPCDAWPDLALIGCWLGGSVGFQAGQLATWYGDVPLRDLGFWASEGRMTIPLTDHDAAGVLAVHENFYEFIPEDDLGREGVTPLRAHQIENGKRYYIVISAGNGLYRYDINDIVEVRGFFNATPRIAFVRKGRDMINITGEKLHLNHIQTALRSAEARSLIKVIQFRVIPDVPASRYDVLIETRSTVCPANAGTFLEAFDRTLAACNVEYAGKRASRRLAPPRLHLMRPGWSQRFAAADISRGKREAQYKWQQITQAWDELDRREALDPKANEAPQTPGLMYEAQSGGII